MIGKAILGGYPGQIFVYGYNYRKRTLHVFNPPRMRTEALNVALIGQVTPTGSPDHNIWFDVANHFGVAPTQIPIARITQAQLNKVAGFAQLNQGMTTLAPSKVDKFSHGDWLSHATQQLDSVELAVRARHPKATVCFCIAPNPRNAPLRLQTFGHKLTWDGAHQRVAYSRKGGGTFNINDFAEQQLDLIAGFVEIYLCRAIIRSSSWRFLGNCYGAQIMWLSLGGGITSFKRDIGQRHQDSFVAQPGINQPHLNVTWDDGVSIGDRTHGEPLTHSVPINFNNTVYNTDYHHGCMMILSPALEALQIQGALDVGEHELAAAVTAGPNQRQFNNADQFLKRFRKYADARRWDPSSPGAKPGYAQKSSRTWRWVGEYHYARARVSGFQGHPLLHLDILHANQTGTQRYMDNQLFGT